MNQQKEIPKHGMYIYIQRKGSADFKRLFMIQFKLNSFRHYGSLYVYERAMFITIINFSWPNCFTLYLSLSLSPKNLRLFFFLCVRVDGIH